MSIRDTTKDLGPDILAREKMRPLSDAERIAHIGTWFRDHEGQTTWSAEMYRIYGVSPDTFVPNAESVLNLIHREDRQVMQAWIRACAAGEQPDALEFRIILPDGSVRFISGRGERTKDIGNSPFLMAGTAQDITERKQIESALRESEDRYRDLVESSQDLICTHNLAGILLSVNSAVVRFTGYTREALLGRNLADLLSKGSQAGFAAYLAEIRTKGAAHGLMQIRTAVGEKRWWEYHNTLRTEGVAAPLVRGTAQDVTERKRAEDTLRESEARFRSLTEMTSDFYWESDAEHRLLLRSSDRKDATKSTFSSDRGLGKRRWEIPYIAPDEAGWTAHRAALDAHQTFRDFELSRYADDGTVLHFSISGEPQFDTSGAFKGYRGVGTDITVRKQADEELRRFSAVMDAISDGIYLVDRSSMRFIYINDAACRMQNQTREGLFALGPEGVNSTSRAKLERTYDNVIAGGAAAEPLEMLRPRNDGTEAWVELRRHAHRSGDRWTIVTLVRDITERKKSEERLKLFRALIEQSSDAIEVVDPATFRFLDVNQKGCRALGYSREEMLSLTVFDIDPVFDRSASMEFVQSLRKSGSITIESRHRRKDGSEFPVEVSISLVQLDREYAIFIARDSTERQQATRQLVESEQRFRSLVEQSIAGIFIIQDGRLPYVNPRLVEILGHESADQLIGSDALLSIAEQDRSRIAETARELIENKVSSKSYECTMLRRDGSLVQVGVHATLATHQGRPAIIGLMQDISDKKRAEEDGRRYTAQLEAALMSTVGVATTLTELRDPYTAGHARRVGEIAVAIGAELGFDQHRQKGLRVAGRLHDVGKIAVPSDILSKPGKLSKLEYDLIKGHAWTGYEVLKDVQSPWPVAEVALQHHERIDGSGYPQGLKGDAILLESRIIAVADVIEAMSSHRPYRTALGVEAALAEIERGRGTVYDLDVADAGLKLFREKGYTIPA